MAILAGELGASPLSGIFNAARITPGLRGFSFEDWPPHDTITGASPPGAIVRQLPVSARQEVIAGQAVRSFSDDYYHRLHVIPRVLTLGNLITDQTNLAHIWNAYLVPQTLVSISELPDGITLDGPDVLPMEFGAIQISAWDVNVSAEGAASIDITIVWDFTGIPDASLPVTGARVVLWPFKPNWKTPVEEPLEWRTSVIKAYAGDEQRIQLRSKARRRLAYDMLLKGAATQVFDNLLFGWQNKQFGVPFWQFGTPLTNGIAAGALALPVNTADCGFAAGNLVVVFRDRDNYEVVEIEEDGVAAETLTLVRATQSAWPVGTQVYPIGVGIVEGNVPVLRQTSSALTSRINFLMMPTSTDSFTPEEAATDTYNGYEVILRKPNWVAPIDNSSDYPYEARDYLVGAIDVIETHDFPTLMKRYSWLFKNRADARSFRAFLQRRRGMLNPVYLPSWNSDLTLAETITALSPVATFVNRGFVPLVGEHPARKHLMIRLRNGTSFLRPIESVTEVGLNIVISLGTVLGTQVAIADVLDVHFVGLYRFAVDRISLIWHTDRVAVVEAPFQLVKA